MQALIDFDGWRKWKDFSSNPSASGSGEAGAAGPSSSTGQVNGSATPGKARRKPMSIRRKKPSSEGGDRSGKAPIPEQPETVAGPSGTSGTYSRNESSGATEGDRNRSDSGTGSSSTRDKSSSDASGGSGTAPAVSDLLTVPKEP